MKKLIALLGLTLCLGFSCPVNNFTQVRAEETTSESADLPADDSSTSEEITSVADEEEKEEAEEESFFDDVSQSAKDAIAVVKEVLNQPVVIGGMTMTLGAFILWIAGKIIDKITASKAGSANAEKLKEVYNVIASQEATISEQKDAYKQLYNVLNVVVANIKNSNVRENALSLLNECSPVVEHVKDYIKNESETVKEDTKAEILEDAKKVIDILTKD